GPVRAAGSSRERRCDGASERLRVHDEEPRRNSRPNRRCPWHVVEKRQLAEDVPRLLGDRRPAARDLDLALGDGEELQSGLAFPEQHRPAWYVDAVGGPDEHVEAFLWERCEQRDAPKFGAPRVEGMLPRETCPQATQPASFRALAP